MFSGMYDIHNGKHDRRHSGSTTDCTNATLQVTYFLLYHIHRRIGEAGIKISILFQIKELSYLLSIVIFKCGTLYDRCESRFSILRGIPGLHTLCFQSVITHNQILLKNNEKNLHSSRFIIMYGVLLCNYLCQKLQFFH